MLMEKLTSEIKRLMSAKQNSTNERERGENALKLNAVKSVLTAISNSEVSGKERKSLSESEVEGVLRKQVKNRREASEIYHNAGEFERAENEKIEADHLDSFLPKQLSESEVEKLVEEIITNENLQEMGGKGMGVVMKHLKSRSDIDPSMASRIAKAKLM